MKKIAPYIDHTILKPNATSADIKKICEEAKENNFAAVCISPYYVSLSRELLEGTIIKVATVIGFPYGYDSIPSKIEGIKRAIDDGADEIDAVVNQSAIANSDWSYVLNDIESMNRICRLKGVLLKVIFEIDLLTNSDIIKLCNICNKVDVDYIKTSTGTLGNGATIEAVKLMIEHSPNLKVKASGGIRTAKDALAFIELGVARIGASQGVAIVKELIEK